MVLLQTPKGQQLSHKGGQMKLMILAEDFCILSLTATNLGLSILEAKAKREKEMAQFSITW